ncbi:Peptidyl-tRNA hydrolase [Pelomyxa schiedti]|nr:Peptidyl-tRNA hydrolase [Pelomyxa schiedti]
MSLSPLESTSPRNEDQTPQQQQQPPSQSPSSSPPHQQQPPPSLQPQQLQLQPQPMPSYHGGGGSRHTSPTPPFFSHTAPVVLLPTCLSSSASSSSSMVSPGASTPSMSVVLAPVSPSLSPSLMCVSPHLPSVVQSPRIPSPPPSSPALSPAPGCFMMLGGGTGGLLGSSSSSSSGASSLTASGAGMGASGGMTFDGSSYDEELSASIRLSLERSSSASPEPQSLHLNRSGEDISDIPPTISCMATKFPPLGHSALSIDNNEILMEKLQAVAASQQRKRRQQIKMVMVVRQDLKMGVGKIAAQCCHAALGLYKEAMATDRGKELVNTWEHYGCCKVVVKANSQFELETLLGQAHSLDLFCHLVADAGRTQVTPGTITVMSLIGESEEVDKITGHLKLL